MQTKQAQILWTSNEVEHLTGGVSNMPWAATGVCISLDELKPGDLFFSGPKDNVDLAIQKGAAAIVTEAVTLSSQRYPCLKVASTYEALKILARAARHRTHALVTCVQGHALKQQIANLLSKSGTVHQAGRHFSTSLASLPEDASYGLFGFSSQIAPDIAVISDPSSVPPIFLDNMPPYSALIINSDMPDFAPLWQQAKRLGLSNIYSYSMQTPSDSYFENIEYGHQTITATLNLCGNYFEVSIPSADSLSFILSASLILKHSGCTNTQIASVFSNFTNTSPQAETPCYVQKKFLKNLQSRHDIFRVMNVINLSMHNKIAMLKNVSSPGAAHDNMGGQSAAYSQMPSNLENTRLIYTAKNDPISKSSQREWNGKSFEKIVPDVLSPGDFLVFKPLAKASKSIFSSALRLIDAPASEQA